MDEIVSTAVVSSWENALWRGIDAYLRFNVATKFSFLCGHFCKSLSREIFYKLRMNQPTLGNKKDIYHKNALASFLVALFKSNFYQQMCAVLLSSDNLMHLCFLELGTGILMPICFTHFCVSNGTSEAIFVGHKQVWVSCFSGSHDFIKNLKNKTLFKTISSSERHLPLRFNPTDVLDYNCTFWPWAVKQVQSRL